MTRNSTTWTTVFFRVALMLLPTGALQGQEATTRLARYFAVQDEKQPLNGVVVVQRKGKTLYAKAFGYASAEYRVKHTPATRFPIASLTKPFIATSVLLLEQQHRLSVKDRIRKYLPEVPAGWEHITIEHLLTHTSGIGAYPAHDQFDTLKHLETTNSQLLQQITRLPLQFEAGASYDYCNSNYMVLACLIERLTGSTVNRFVQREICQPLGLKNTFFPDSRIPVDGLASGYLWQDKLFKADHVNLSQLSGAGGLVSTAGDLSLFLRATAF